MRAIAVISLALIGAVGSHGDSIAKLRRSPELAFHLPGVGDKLLSQYRGHVVALEFILTTCSHCQAASQVMTRMQDRYGDQGLQVLDVAIDQNADLRVENFARDFRVSFPVGWTSLEQMMAYMGFTGLPSVPQLVLIDREGIIHYETPRQGDAEAVKEDLVASRIEELLKAKSTTHMRRSRAAGRTTGE